MLNPAPLLDLLKTEIADNYGISIPLYKKIQRGLYKAIENNLIGSDEALPSERDLAASLGVSRITIRRAIAVMAENGALLQRRGAGTFVNIRVVQPLSNLTSFTEDMASRGIKTDLIWLDRSVGIASPHEAEMLQLTAGSKISRLYRMRRADDRPLCLEYACLPNKFVPEPKLIKKSLYKYLDGIGKKPIRAMQKISAELFTIEHAHLLGVEPHSACLYIERRSFLDDGTPVEFVCSHYRGDSYDFIVELKL